MKLNCMYLLFFLSAFFVFPTYGSQHYSIDQIERFILNNEHSKINSILDGADSENMTWEHYHYLAVSSYKVGNKNKALLNSVKSLLLNPFSKNNMNNLEIYDKTFAIKQIPQIVSISKLRFWSSCLVLVLLILGVIFFKVRSVRVITSIFQVLVFAALFSNNNIRNTVDIKSVTMLKDDSSKVHLNPLAESSANPNIVSNDILFIRRLVNPWVFVENIYGEPGWVNKIDLIK